ncbi:hypothetical protein G6F42_018427 [Rhizopus arrhizus]|nr:hypothetical protein G6F42_018427 [Rhizopus arrhizus]
MSDPINTSNVEQQIFTKEQVDALIEAVTKRVRETQAEEAEQRNKGFEIPVEICEELDSYNTFELQKALQKFKRSVPKYNNEDWNTPESTNPNFIPQLKQGKVDTLQLVSTIYKHTENTRAQARAASEIFESLQYISERGMQQEDEELYHTTMEKARRLAVFGFGTARQQENEAKEATTKSLRLPYSLKHLETPESGEKKYAFSNEFIEQYYEETFKQKVTKDEVVDSEAMDIEKEDLFYPTEGEVVEAGNSRGETSPTALTIRLPGRTKTITPNREGTTTAFNTRFDSTSTAPGNLTDDSTSNHINTSKNQQLFDSSGWYLTRGPFTPLCPQLEENYGSLLADFSCGNRLPTTIRTYTNTMANETITFEYGGSSCSRFSSSEIYQGRDHYTFPISKQRFSLNLFYNSGSDQTSTDLELHKIEPIFTDTAFQDGRSPSVERYHRERRLYVQGRSQRRICSSTSSQSFTKIFDIREQQYCLPIHLSSLRSEHCTSSFFKIDEICGRAFTGEGYAPCLLSRRYLCIGEIEKQDARISTDTNSTSRESGLPHPQGEECARAEKDPGISRVSIQHSNNVNLSSNPQSNQVTTANQTNRGTSHTIMPMDSESVREDDSRHPSNRGSSVTYPTHATRFIQKLEDTQSQLGQELQTISPIDGGDHMVEKIFSKEKRSTNSQTTNSRTICQDLQWVKKLHQRNLIFRK